MNRWLFGLLFVSELLTFASQVNAADDGLQSAAVVQELLATESITEMQLRADILAECAVEDADVQRLIDAAKETKSDARRNLLWHAIRFTRSTLARDFLIEALRSAAVPLRIEWIESLRNPAAFDIPILTAVYKSTENGTASDESSLQEFFVRFALSSWRDTRVADWHSTRNTELYHGAKNRRQADADAAQLRILTYLITRGHDIETRIAAFQYKGHSWFRGFEVENRARFARQLLNTAEAPSERSRLVSVLRDQIEPSWFLYGSESREVKLAAIAAMGELVADNWRSTAGYDSLRKTYKELLPIAQDEDDSELSRAASKMIRSLEIRYGEKAS